MRLYRTRHGAVAEHHGAFLAIVGAEWDALVNAADDADVLAGARPTTAPPPSELLAPVGTQEIWAAGVTYFRSRDARIEEAHDAGGGDFYARVYDAARPEIFFKAPAWRAVGPGGRVRIRRDAAWSVPEPELALVVDARGTIVGYTIGNDMSARDIEGENPLYLPQAKVYDGSCAIGPCLYLTRDPLPPDTRVVLEIQRASSVAFSESTTISRIKRPFNELVEHLYRETSFPAGCLLLTGTGIVPPADFTLQRGDRVQITIEPIGTLVNDVD
jgi:2-dehydro-3-deoxy-D-arabinonate dehydratase